MAAVNLDASELQAWDRAYRKVSLLMRAYQVENAYVRDELARDIVQDALQNQQSGREPEALAVEKLRGRLSAWLKRLNDATEEHGRNGYSEARMLTIVQASGVIKQWPQYFLADGELPALMLKAVSDARVIGAPNMNRTSIGVPQIQFEAVNDVAEGTRRIFNNSILRICGFAAALVAGVTTIILLAR